MLQLESIYQEKMADLGKAFQFYPWDNKATYANWLAQTYYFARYTTRFLLLIAANLDLTENKLHQRFSTHAQEEKNHEKLIENDLRALGYQLFDFEELACTSGFYQSQFFWIEHVHPLSFFGYIVMLEGLAAKHGAQVFKTAQDSHGAKAASFLKVHALEDVDHLDKAFKEISALKAEIIPHIVANFKFSADQYAAILDGAAQGLRHNENKILDVSLQKKSA